MADVQRLEETLAPYIGLKADPDTYATLRKLRCPQLTFSGSQRANGQYAYNGSGTAPGSGSANLGLSGYWDPSARRFNSMVESGVVAPADLIAAGDIEAKAQGGILWAGIFDPVAKDSSGWPGTSHGGAANMVFCDAHVESQRQTNWIAATDPARARWNNDHQPHPETWARP